MKKIVTVSTIIIMLFSGPVSAQIVNDYQKLGDIAFVEGNYYAAAQYYLKLINGNDKKPRVTPYKVKVEYSATKLPTEPTLTTAEQKQLRVVYKLAESFRLYYNYQDAERWYQEICKSGSKDFPLAKLWYGISLRANQKFEDAATQFREFLKEYEPKNEFSDMAQYNFQCCEFALKELYNARKDIVDRLDNAVNQGSGNWGAMAYSDSLVYFSSSRYRVMEKKEMPSHYNTLYLSKMYEADGLKRLLPPRKVDIALPEGWHQGAVTFTADNKTMYFTRWKKGKSDGLEAEIYRSYFDGNGWSEPGKLSFEVNYPDSRSMHPYITPSGQTLFFASDRPGGFGKFDIWYCTIKPNGEFNQPVNLGSKINTKEDEKSPFYAEEKNTLFFSSNGRIGFGGMDIYEIKGRPEYWEEPENLGYPVNSSKDDMHFVPVSEDLRQAFISSDRLSVCCLELFTVKRDVKNAYIEGLVIDCDSNQPLPGARVLLTDSLSMKYQEQFTNKDGKYVFTVSANQPSYQLNISKDQYFTLNTSLQWSSSTRKDTLINPVVCLKKFEVGKAIVIKDIYYDYDKATLRPRSKVELDSLFIVLQDNPNLVVELSSHTDSKGNDQYNLNLSQRRAQACVNYLIDKGLSASAIIPKGYGESRPVAPNSINGKDNPEGRQMNRRTEFKVLKINGEQLAKDAYK